MKIAINDTNILIDLIRIDLIYELFSLDFEFITSDLIVAEFEVEEQRKIINELINQNKLQVYKFDFNELLAIQGIKNKSSKKLSFEDCSVLYLAIKKNAILLTGDNLLRKNATNAGIKVNGILFVLDNLLENKIITAKLAFNKLTNLIALNTRLPKAECKIRLDTWRHH